MCRKTQFVLLVALALISAATSRFISNNIDELSDDYDEYDSKEDLPLYKVVNNGKEMDMDDRVFDRTFAEESAGDSDEEGIVPELDERIGIPVDYESNDGNRVVLKNKFGSDNNNDETNPGWLRRQWRRLGNVATAITNGKKVSTEKVNEFTEKICTLIRFMTSRASQICKFVPLQVCESFYGAKDGGNVVLPDGIPMEIPANNI